MLRKRDVGVSNLPVMRIVLHGENELVKINSKLKKTTEKKGKNTEKPRATEETYQKRIEDFSNLLSSSYVRFLLSRGFKDFRDKNKHLFEQENNA